MGGQRNFDSNGPDVKIRGTAAHIFDRYCQLARDATAIGDRIAAENFLQHAEHYYRIMMASNGGSPATNGQPPGFSPQPNVGNDEGDGDGEGESEGDLDGELASADPA